MNANKLNQIPRKLIDYSVRKQTLNEFVKRLKLQLKKKNKNSFTHLNCKLQRLV